MKCHLPTGREGYFKWGKSFAKSGTGGGLGPDPGGPGGLGAPLWEEKKILNRNNIRSGDWYYGEKHLLIDFVKN